MLTVLILQRFGRAIEQWILDPMSAVDQFESAGQRSESILVDGLQWQGFGFVMATIRGEIFDGERHLGLCDSQIERLFHIATSEEERNEYACEMEQLDETNHR